MEKDERIKDHITNENEIRRHQAVGFFFEKF